MRNAGGTILGADNKSAVAAMLEAARRVARREPPARRHRAPLHAQGGGRAARRGRVRPRRGSRARLGYVYDQAAPIGDVILGAPYSQAMRCGSTAVPRTPGMYPEEGRSAIAAAARAIADLRLGRVDEETTANVGMIQGGTARQHRPRVVHVRRRGALARRAQARRPRPGDARRVRLRGQRSRMRGRDAGVEELPRLPLQARRPGRARRHDGARARRLRAAATGSTGGAADANVFNERGLAVPQPRQRDDRTSTRRTSTSRSPTSRRWSR